MNNGETSKHYSYQPAPDVRKHTTADGAFLMNVKSGFCFHLNPVGAMIWSEIAQSCSIANITATLEKAFPMIPPSALGSDLIGFIDRLIAHELIIRVSS